MKRKIVRIQKFANGSKPQVSRIYDRVREYAEPHHDSHDLEEAALRNAELSEFARIAEDEDHPEPSHIDEINTTDTTEEVAHGLAESLDEPVVSPQVPATPVIRISVRMSPKDHLQLKLIAAHTQMSAQSIFETALEEYVINHGSEILPQSCNCVLDKSSL
mgnify:CR=1 FL=1